MAHGRDWGHQVVREIRIYVEGGGYDKESKAQMREGFSHFLNSLRSVAQSKYIRWQIIACGSRNDAYRSFQLATETHTAAFNILLVDAESPVHQQPKQHLNSQNGWDLGDASSEQCHLMVQIYGSVADSRCGGASEILRSRF